MEIPRILVQWPLQAVLAIVAGLIILIVPRVLNYAVATYLLAVGALGLLLVYQGQAVKAQTIIALVAGVLILVKPNILNYVIGIYLILVGLLEAGVIRI